MQFDQNSSSTSPNRFAISTNQQHNLVVGQRRARIPGQTCGYPTKSGNGPCSLPASQSDEGEEEVTEDG